MCHEATDSDWVDPGYPSPLVEQAVRRIGRPGVALDLASGGGRNARFLAEHGWRVVAVDLSRDGLERTRSLTPAVLPVRADLRRFAVRPEAVDLAVMSFYLERGLFPLVREALRSGGHVVVETYSVLELDELGGDVSRRFTLERGELLRAFAGFEILLHEEGIFEREEGERGLARLLARKP